MDPLYHSSVCWECGGGEVVIECHVGYIIIIIIVGALHEIALIFKYACEKVTDTSQCTRHLANGANHRPVKMLHFKDEYPLKKVRSTKSNECT